MILSAYREWASEQVRRALRTLGLPEPSRIEWRDLPFDYTWGMATPLAMQLAAQEKKSRPDLNVPARAQEIAERLAEQLRETLRADPRFQRVEAVRGYLNLYFNPSQVARSVIETVLREGPDYGRGAPKGERVMVEFSQPNTHKAFHIGHLRNAVLGDALSRILDFAGFEVIRATYPGDIGAHVIKCLWGYLRFHRGEEPAERRGAWLGQVYAEAEARLEEADAYRREVVRFLLTAFREEGVTPWVRDFLLTRLSEAMAAHAASGPVGQKDAAVLIRAMAMGELPDLDAVADKDWLWSLWEAMGRWLSELEEKARVRRGKGGEADRQAVAWLQARYREIGHRPEEWNYEKELRALYARWEARDPELIELWRRTREWSLEEFQRIYEELGITFDVWFFESEVEEEGKRIVEELIARGIATDLRPHGPVVVEIDRLLGQEGKEEYRTLVILRSDGTTLYSTKDLALAKRKFEQYRIDRSIYVVDVRQSLYFKQIFKILELWGFPQASKCYHLAYEMVTLPGGKMSSRAGTVVLYEDFAAEARERARRIVEEKNPELPPERKAEIARAVALGVMKYSMLSVDNNKVIVFDWDAALNLEGQTGPYLQYAHARACRILEKAEAPVTLDGDHIFETLEPQEVALIEAIAAFPDLVQAAAERYKPLLIANYVFDLARAFNEFYRDCPVLTAPSPIREGRLALVAAARQTLANALQLLGIPAPEIL